MGHHSPAVLKLHEGKRDGKLEQFFLPIMHKDDKFLVVFSFIKLGLLEVRTREAGQRTSRCPLPPVVESNRDQTRQ